MRILFTGGGTGGHFYPIIAVAREIKRIAEEERLVDTRLFYLGPIVIGEDDLKREGITYYPLAVGKIRRYFSFKNFSDVFKIFIGIMQAAWRMFIILPDIVFSKGGYGAFPVLLIAKLYRIPVIIHESDSVPGAVNKWSSKFAVRIGVAFSEGAKYFSPEKTAFTGNPIRNRLWGANKELAKKGLAISSPDPIIFFNGGSLGSQNLNNIVIDMLPGLIKKYEVIHQTGKDNFEAVLQETGIILERMKKERYHPFPFLGEDKLREAYAASDLILSRAGASAIFEIAALNKPSILIPLKDSAQNHQLENAFTYARNGASVVIEEDNLTPHLLLSEIEKIFDHPEVRKRMEEAAQKFARIDSAEIIAREIIKLGLH